MARKVQISGASSAVEATPQTHKAQAFANLGQQIQKSVNVGADIYQRSQKALTTSQLRKDGALMDNSWKAFNAKHKNNYNTEIFNREISELVQTQISEVNANADLTPDARKNLLSNIDLQRDIASKNFETNQGFAMTQAAISNTNEAIAVEVRSGNADAANAIFDSAVKDGLFAGDESSLKKVRREIAVGVSYYTDMDGIEAATDVYNISQQLKKIGKNRKYSDTQRNNLIAAGNAKQKGLLKGQNEYEKFIEDRFSDGRITQDMVDQIEDPYAREMYQTLFNNEVASAEGKLVETPKGQFKLYMSDAERAKGKVEPTNVKLDTFKQADLIRDGIDNYLINGNMRFPSENDFNKDGELKSWKASKWQAYEGEEAYKLLLWNIQASDADPIIKAKWREDLRKAKVGENAEKLYQPRAVGSSYEMGKTAEYKDLSSKIDDYTALYPAIDKIGILGSVKAQYDALKADGKNHNEAMNEALKPLKEKNDRLRVEASLPEALGIIKNPIEDSTKDTSEVVNWSDL